MNKSTYGLIVLVALVMITPAVVIAESENEANEGSERENGEREGNEGVVGNFTSGIILYLTLAAIVGVGSYSAFKVYQARKRAIKKLV